MFAVIFEVEPTNDGKQEYLDIAATRRPALGGIDGFISIERFASLNNEGKILSLSYWRDEKAVLEWRQHAQHREAQNKGRNSLF
jgi:heme-degrading monooxygenase HmoA